MANRALLVGINAYPRQALRGCINDVQDLARFLVEQRGFAASDVRLLTDKDATTAGIRDNLTGWLLAQAAPGDRLVYHFSGHGSRLLSADGEVHDVICPVDFDFTAARSLSDADFKQIFAAVPAGADFNWISDSCHSGDLARSWGMRDVLPRYLPPPPELARQIERALARRAKTRGLGQAEEHINGVLIAGCQSDQESADAKINGRFNGALSYYLLRELTSDKGLSTDIETVVKNATAQLQAERYEQIPQVRGQPVARKKPFLGTMSATVAVASPPATPATSPAATAVPSVLVAAAAALTPAVAAAANPPAGPGTVGPTTVGPGTAIPGTTMTLEEVAEARGWRERDDDAVSRGLGGNTPTTMSKAELAAIPNEKIAALVSDETHALVIAAEIGSRAEYDKKYKHPEWPQGESGVTIGFGSDLGYFDHTSMQGAWGGLIADPDYKRLEKCCGLKGSSASAALGSVKDISVPWEKADVAYHRHEVPEYGRQVIGALPNAMELHPHCFGALFSLVYNRGPGMGTSGDDKRREMRNIRDHMAAHRFDKVPGEFRAMKRLWVGKFAGLVKRREDEAKLFEKGLKAKQTQVATTVSGVAAAAAGAAAIPPKPVAVTAPAAAPDPVAAAAPASHPVAASQPAFPGGPSRFR